jgi:hypothetical protein
LRSYWTLRESDEDEDEDRAVPAAVAAAVAVAPREGAPDNMHALAPDIGPIDVNIEVQNAHHIGGMLQLGEDLEQEEDADEEEEEEEELHQEVEDSDEDDREPDEDDIEDMFELAQAVVNRARENDPQNRGPPPIPPPPPPINRNPLQPNNGGAAERPQMNRGVENVDVEVQINLDVVGLRGPLFGFMIYCGWLIVFNSICILFGVLAPVIVKEYSYHFVFRHIWNFILYLLQVTSSHWHWGNPFDDSTISHFFNDHWETFSSTLALFKLLLEPTATTETTTIQIFRFTDLINITTAYIVLSLYVSIFNSLLLVITRALYGPSPGGGQGEGQGQADPHQNNPRIPRNLQFLLTYIPRVVDIIKIGTLMTIRIFWLPCLIGSLVILCFNLLFQIPLEELFLWCGNHIIGAIAMCWGVGIAYMLTTTISILQLREILHPDWLSKFIRPQESQVDLLTSLLLDPPLTQLRRLFLSFFVYALLILIFVFLPIVIWKYLGAPLVADIIATIDLTECSGSIPPIPIHFWYFTPDLQIFLEIGFLHTFFLMLLEKRKDLIGHWEYYLLKYFTKQLGISRYILPYAMKILSVSHIPSPPLLMNSSLSVIVEP